MVTSSCHSNQSLYWADKVKHKTWKFQENQVFQLLHETRKIFQVQSTELMYFSFNNIYDI